MPYCWEWPSSVERLDGELEGVPGFGYEVKAGVDPADDHDAGAGDPLAIVAVEDREVVGGRPVTEVADLVGGLALTGG